jgi:hypothetical protein
MYVDPDPECAEEGWGTARATAAPVAVATAVAGAYVLTYGADRFFTYPDALGEYGLALQFVLLGGLLVAHEAVHALSYATLAGLSPAEIEVEAELLPDGSYDPVHLSVHPARPVRRSAYAAGVAMPGLVLGVAPAAVGLFTGHPLVTFVGLAGIVLVATDVETLVALSRRADAASRPESTSAP